METRSLGKTGLRVSQIGLCLPGDVAVAEAITRRGRGEGATFFVATDPAVHAAAADVLRDDEEAVVAYARKDGTYLLKAAAGGQVALGCAARAAADLPKEPACVFGTYNMFEQELSAAVFSPAVRGGHGVVVTHVLAGGALAGRIGHTPAKAAVANLRPLVKPRRTLAQTAILFALANEYVSSAVVRVSSMEHLREALGSAEAEPLTFSELELIFETYANRYDTK